MYILDVAPNKACLNEQTICIKFHITQKPVSLLTVPASQLYYIEMKIMSNGDANRNSSAV